MLLHASLAGIGWSACWRFMDNLAAHKVAGIREAVAAAGASLLYLPPHSPDLNPWSGSSRIIRALQGTGPAGPGGEQVFAKLKTLLRQAAVRTHQTLWNTIGHLLDAFSPTECANYLSNAGYALN
jgi:transposase